MAVTLPFQLSRSVFSRQTELCACRCVSLAGPFQLADTRRGHHSQTQTSSSPKDSDDLRSKPKLYFATQRYASTLSPSRSSRSNISTQQTGVREAPMSQQRRLLSSSSTPAANSETQVQPGESGLAPAKVAASTLPSFSFARPKQLPIRHGHHVCSLKMSSYRDDLSNLTFYAQFCVHAAHAFGLPCTMPISLPVKTSLRTVPRSPFVHKPSQENFMKKTHSRCIKIFDADSNVVGQWLDYLAENTMSGVRLNATMFDRKALGYGQEMVSESVELEQTEEMKVKEMAETLLASGFGESVAAEGDSSAKAADADATEPAAIESKETNA